MTVAQAAKLLGVSRQRVHYMIDQGLLTVSRVEKDFPGGTRRWILRANVMALKARRRAAAL